MTADPSSTSLHELLERLATLEKISADERASVAAVIDSKDSIPLAPDLMSEKNELGASAAVSSPLPQPGAKSDSEEQLYIRITKMLLPEKIKLALLGNATCRTLLIRDPNRMIQAFVLKNPRLQPKEVEEFARNPNLSEFVIRTIADNQNWTKGYGMKLNLVLNPKTPLEISLKFLRFLNAGDVKRIAKSKNLPQTLVVAARKKISDAQPGS